MSTYKHGGEGYFCSSIHRLSLPVTRDRKTECEKMLIFFGGVQSCQRAYNSILADLGVEAYVDKNLVIEMFHAHHKPETKERILNTFKSTASNIRVLLSTVAFSMGIQIPDIDVVIQFIHFRVQCMGPLKS